jgi:hypothetical protein
MRWAPLFYPQLILGFAILIIDLWKMW